MGDRVVFRGGTNKLNATFTSTTRKPELDAEGNPTGSFIVTTYTRRANLGMAAQCQRLDLISQILESTRAALSVRRSAKENANLEDKKAERACNRDDTFLALTAAFEQMKGEILGEEQ